MCMNIDRVDMAMKREEIHKGGYWIGFAYVYAVPMSVIWMLVNSYGISYAYVYAVPCIM